MFQNRQSRTILRSGLICNASAGKRQAHWYSIWSEKSCQIMIKLTIQSNLSNFVAYAVQTGRISV